MDKPPRPQKRGFYRLRYPAAERPTLSIGDRKFVVSEVSEEGARIVISGSCSLDPNKPFSGVLTFPTGETESIKGSVLRSTDNEIVANLTSGISLKRMTAEQIRLRQKYPPVAGTTDE